MNSPLEFRCHCSKRPLLGVIRFDEDDAPTFHVRSWKQKRLFVDIEIQGSIAITCRECNRKHRLNVQPNEDPQASSS